MDREPSRGSVVIVDDDMSVRRLLAEALRLEGFTVEVSASARDGFEVIERVQPDVALVDVMMPGGDGLGLVTRLRGSARHRDLPVAMLTARAQQEDLDRGRRAGADVYITKPFSIEQLVWHLDEMVHNRPEPTRAAPDDSLARLRRNGPLSMQALVERSISQTPPAVAAEVS